MTTSWHVDPDELDAYLDDRIDVGPAASVEAHLLTCASCRQRLASSVPTPDLDRSWQRVELRIDDSIQSSAERVVQAIGIRDTDARLLLSTPRLRWSWLVALALTLVLAVLVADLRAVASGELTTLVFLTLAPLAPLLGVAAAFGPETDPTFEVALAAPTPRLRLLAVRATAVFVSSAVVGVLTGLALPGPWWRATLWLLPALVLSLVTVALPTTRPPVTIIAGLGTAWVVVVGTWVSISDDRLAPFRTGSQLLYLATTVALALAIALTRDHEHPTALARRRTP